MQPETVAGPTFGQAVARREDDRMVRGQGRYADDIAAPDALHVAFVRSPHAAARVLSIDAEEALSRPGVQAVLTAADLARDGVPDFIPPVKVSNFDGTVSTETPRALLAREEVRFIGEPVAMVLASTAAQALDAAEAVDVDYDPLDAVVAANGDPAANGRLVWPDRPGNLAFHWRRGDLAAVESALSGCWHVTELKAIVSRVSANPLEPRAALAYVEQSGRPVLHATHQSPQALRNALCQLFGLERHALRVIASDVGGSFGLKSGLPREETLCFWAARLLSRAVRWTATRSESFLADEHGRDSAISARLGLDTDGSFVALQVRFDVNIGAYLSTRSTSLINNIGGIAGVYRTPLIVGEVVGHLTNTQPIAAYRGAGRPEATFAVERLIDMAAREIGVDRAELRRRNLIRPEAMPYQTPFVFRYDCGEFERNLDKALELAGYAGFPERRRESEARGKLRGIGIANPIEVAAGPVGRPATDHALVRMHADGSATLLSGTMSVGQGHETSMSALVAEALGIPQERVRYLQGDTDAIPDGKGNGGSAGLTLGGAAISIAIDELLRRGAAIASDALEVSEFDLEFTRGEFRVVGSDRSASLAEVAGLAESAAGEGLFGRGAFKMEQPTYPNGCHICEVEIDPDTGAVEMAGYTSVEDVGRVLNAALVDGQIHGGVAQGIGQALGEAIRFSEDGQIQTGSFMDYAMPRASDLPNVVSVHLETPTALNPLGVKGVGEAGTVGALAATMNAVCDALAPLGIRHFDMPATPERLWQAIVAARAQTQREES